MSPTAVRAPPRSRSLITSWGFAAPQADLMADVILGRADVRTGIIWYVWAGIRIAFLAYLYVTVARISRTHRLARNGSGTL
jgi:hypothetical protein